MNTNATKPDSKTEKTAATKPTEPANKPAISDASSKKPAARGNTHDGKIVSIAGKKLVMSSHEGKEYSHTLSEDASVCCDGTACKSENLKVGSRIRLTTSPNDKRIAVKIESLDKQAEFAKSI